MASRDELAVEIVSSVHTHNPKINCSVEFYPPTDEDVARLCDLIDQQLEAKRLAAITGNKQP